MNPPPKSNPSWDEGALGFRRPLGRPCPGLGAVLNPPRGPGLFVSSETRVAKEAALLYHRATARVVLEGRPQKATPLAGTCAVHPGPGGGGERGGSLVTPRAWARGGGPLSLKRPHFKCGKMGPRPHFIGGGWGPHQLWGSPGPGRGPPNSPSVWKLGVPQKGEGWPNPLPRHRFGFRGGGSGLKHPKKKGWPLPLWGPPNHVAGGGENPHPRGKAGCLGKTPPPRGPLP